MAEPIVSTKRCMTCLAEKPLAEFYRCKRWKDGLSYRCKGCDKAAMIKYRKTPKGRETGRIARQRFQATPTGQACITAYRRSEAGKEAARQYRLRAGKTVLNARAAANRAVAKGKLPRPDTLPCQECGQSASQYHHHQGYEREHWIHVIPVCTKCHARLDANAKKPY